LFARRENVSAPNRYSSNLNRAMNFTMDDNVQPRFGAQNEHSQLHRGLKSEGFPNLAD